MERYSSWYVIGNLILLCFLRQMGFLQLKGEGRDAVLVADIQVFANRRARNEIISDDLGEGILLQKATIEMF